MVSISGFVESRPLAVESDRAITDGDRVRASVGDRRPREDVGMHTYGQPDSEAALFALDGFKASTLHATRRCLLDHDRCRC
ncbi:hypothetical protein GGE12_001857 [Rhizobium mongolense]|uniref:Uncharacterized protein n=1 Tax=Rhizobium mongolense TaxID=57676 RepID=A0A7W6WD85_9HYPH|nr:hypothetical protein [Rhizobium mongolense]